MRLEYDLVFTESWRVGSGEGAGCGAPVQNDRIFMIHGTGAVIYS